MENLWSGLQILWDYEESCEFYKMIWFYNLKLSKKQNKNEKTIRFSCWAIKFWIATAASTFTGNSSLASDNRNTSELIIFSSTWTEILANANSLKDNYGK